MFGMLRHLYIAYNIYCNLRTDFPAHSWYSNGLARPYSSHYIHLHSPYSHHRSPQRAIWCHLRKRANRWWYWWHYTLMHTECSPLWMCRCCNLRLWNSLWCMLLLHYRKYTHFDKLCMWYLRSRGYNWVCMVCMNLFHRSNSRQSRYDRLWRLTNRSCK